MAMLTVATQLANSQAQVPEALAKKNVLNGSWYVGNMETDLSSSALSAFLVGRIGEVSYGPSTPYRNIIDSNEPWQVEAYWITYGSLDPFICGKWCARLYLETLGKNDIDLEVNCDQGLIDFAPSVSGFSIYYASFTFKGGEVKPEHTGTPFQPVLTVTSLTSYMRGPGLDPNDDKSYFTGQMTGFVPFRITEFLKEEIG